MRILLIHDTLLMPTNARSILSNFGQVIEFNDGMESINKIVNCNITNIDVVFIDIILPKVSGIEIVKKIREIEKVRQPEKIAYIVMVSLPGHAIEDQELIKIGANKVFIKPITYEAVKEYFIEIGLIEKSY